MQPYIAAVAQLAPVPFDPLRSAEIAAAAIADAARNNAKIVVFPEAFLGGYPKGASFGAPVGTRSPAGRAAFQRYYDGAIDLAGPETALIAEAACEHKMFVVIGCIERSGGTLYCTALFFNGERGLVAKHRKLMPTAAERLIWGFGDGSTLPVLDTPLGKIGAVICWENYMPMLRMHMYAKGISIYCAPTVDDRDSWLSTMRHVALEGRCFVLTACQRITRAAYPTDYECSFGNDPATVLIRGGSAVIDPLGNVLAGPDFSGESILYAEIDPSVVTRGKYDLDVAGHYARPDIFSLSVNETPQQAVVVTRD
ncbi:MAG TPA: carbon-nitrogen hydrolase family protein [Rhizomicrobium sp.]|jgi:nitrilase